MKSTFNFGMSLLAGAFFFSSCGNNTTATKESKDSATPSASSTMHDTMSNMMHAGDTSGMNRGGGMMGPMHATLTKMQSMKMTGDFDIDFANMIIEHHQGGIDMAQMEVSQGKDEKMKALAQKNIDEQKKEQQELRDFVASYKPTGMKHGEGALQKSMSDMMGQMGSMQMAGDADKDFATMMMHHHQHGVAMSKMELTNGMSDKLKKMAQKSINEQTKEISEFKSWLASHK